MSIKQIADPTIQDVLYHKKQEIFKEINKVKIGKVEAFDTETQAAKISIVYKKLENEDADGVKTLKEYPLQLDCPVIQLYGGPAGLDMPVSVGDYALVFYNDEDIDNWFNGTLGTAPNTPRKHDQSDSFALIGIRNLISALEDFANDMVRLRYNETMILVKDGEIDLKTAVLKADGESGVDDSVGVYVASAPGGSPTKKITFKRGVRTS